MSLFESGERLLLAANDGQCYFAVKNSKPKTGKKNWTSKELDYISKRSKEDPFSICGYIKKEMDETLNNAEDLDIEFRLERIPGAARCNKVYAESDGRTFGMLTSTENTTEDLRFSFSQD